MNTEQHRSGWQFSLRSFLFAAIVIGLAAGFVGPIILESITAWRPPPRPVMPNTKSRATFPPESDSENYYESGETPLY